MSNNKEISVELQIHRISQISFRMEEHLFKTDEALGIRIDTKHDMDIDKNLFAITLRINFLYGSKQDEIVVQSEIQNIFLIKDLKKYVKDNVLSMPDNAVITMMTLSISHARALMSKSMSGTLFNGILIPIADGSEVARKHFGFASPIESNS